LSGCTPGVAQVSRSADPVTLQFLVPVPGQAASMRCPAHAVRTCRDDIQLEAVFSLLNRMSSAASVHLAFPRLPLWAKVGAVEVKLGAGIYRLTSPLELKGWLGTEQGGLGPLSIAGAGSGNTVISGSAALAASAWKPVGPEINRLSRIARRSVMVADLSAVLPSPLRAETRSSGFGEALSPVTIEVIADGRFQNPARWPNNGWMTVGRLETPDPSLQRRALIAYTDRASSWENETEMFLVGYPAYDWAYEKIPVESVNAKGILLLRAPGSHFPVQSGQRVAVEHALSELDGAGEWFADSSTQKLYWWPPSPDAVNSVELTISTGHWLVEDSSDVLFSDLELENVRGTSVSIRSGKRISFLNSTVRNAGNLAFNVEGGESVTIRNVKMHDLGEGGVRLMGGDRQTLVPGKHAVEDSSIARFARLSRTYRPAVLLEGVGLRVTGTRIDDGPHAAIVFGGNDHRIEGNHISNVATETNDAGAIYTGRDWTARGTVIANNLLQNIYPRLPGTNSVKGIYLDDQASGTTIQGNIFANVTRAVFIGGGRENIIERNLFVASTPAIFADNRGTTWQRDQISDPNSQLRVSYRNVPVSSPAYLQKYPLLSQILSDEPGRTKYNRATGNIFVSSREFELIEDAQLGLGRSGNFRRDWSIFKTLRGPKAEYLPADFELLVPGQFPSPSVTTPVKIPTPR
jgi:hypothetical protein